MEASRQYGWTEVFLIILLVFVRQSDLASTSFQLMTGIHAREWISPAAVLYVIDTIVQGLPGQDSDLLQLDWHFMPVVNPDGYQYTWDSDRLWRKTRYDMPTCLHDVMQSQRLLVNSFQQQA